MTAIKGLVRPLSLCLSIAILPSPSISLAGTFKGAAIEPADVFMLVAEIRSEIETIRFEIGKPRADQLEMRFENVAPREAFFQAVTLFKKANRLCPEITREQRSTPKTPAGEIHIEHVHWVVEAALERVRKVKAHLDLTTPCATIQRDETKTTTDVLLSIIRANRQLNLLLDHEFSPRDVFQQVTLALSYSTGLRAHFPGKRMPSTPLFERGKKPADVFQKLLGCLKRVQKIALISGVSTLKFDATRVNVDQVSPSDVYDIASLIVAELAFLHRRLEGVEPPYEIYTPGRKFPSHVFQRAGVLEAQLADLEKLAGMNPNWLQ